MGDRPIHPAKVRFKKSSCTYYLKAEEELRIYEIEDFIRVRLVEGEAEVFGRELPLQEIVMFYAGENLAIFTWKYAKIEVEDPQNMVQQD